MFLWRWVASWAPPSSVWGTDNGLAAKLRVGQEALPEQEYPRIPSCRGDLQRTGTNVLGAEHPSPVGLLHCRKGVVAPLLDHTIYLGGDHLILFTWQVVPMRFVGVEAQYTGQLCAPDRPEGGGDALQSVPLLPTLAKRLDLLEDTL